MQPRLLLAGLGIWAAATVLLRVAGQYLISPGPWGRIVLLFLVSFPAMAWLTRQICKRTQRTKEQWPAAGVSLVLPTLLLDPFSTVFFGAVFPNIDPNCAGVFGGLMLWCSAGGLAGVMLGVSDRGR